MNELQPDDISGDDALVNDALVNDASVNDPVIARLRSALDEVTAGATTPSSVTPLSVADGSPAPAGASRGGLGAGRWFAIAAATILVVGAVTAIVAHRNQQSPAASSPTTTVPATTVPATTTVPDPAGTGYWYTLASQDLVPGDIVETPCCASGVGGSPSLSMAWTRGSGLSDGLLTMTEVRGEVLPPDVQHITLDERGDITLVFTSYGITDAERESLAGQVVAGSGLPYILPVDGWQYVAMGYDGSGAQQMQEYTNDQGSVAITVGDYRTQLADLATSTTDIKPVTIAGNAGWAATVDSGTLIVWPVHDTGQWATLRIPIAFADRVNGLIAAVIEQTSADAPANSVPSPTDGVSETTTDPGTHTATLPMLDQTTDADPAVGTAAPAIVGTDLDGNPMTVDFSQPTLLVFVAHWSPHCNAELLVLEAALADGTIPGDVQVVLISTAADDSLDNFPPQQWLANDGWNGAPVLDDSVDRRAAGPVANAYGASGWPFFVSVGSDGLVKARAAGEIPIADLTAMLAPPTSATALSTFDMAAP